MNTAENHLANPRLPTPYTGKMLLVAVLFFFCFMGIMGYKAATHIADPVRDGLTYIEQAEADQHSSLALHDAPAPAAVHELGGLAEQRRKELEKKARDEMLHNASVLGRLHDAAAACKLKMATSMFFYNWSDPCTIVAQDGRALAVDLGGEEGWRGVVPQRWAHRDLLYFDSGAQQIVSDVHTARSMALTPTAEAQLENAFHTAFQALLADVYSVAMWQRITAVQDILPALRVSSVPVPAGVDVKVQRPPEEAHGLGR